ncbi:MAG TPA: hypothetical protein VHZ51_00920 [Ktedonobacteraceae bacterium]|nr:hypothetical protein [Ktedonobacteraceae bacterium]
MTTPVFVAHEQALDTNTVSPADIVHETPHLAASLASLTGKTVVVKLGGSTLEHQRAVLQGSIFLQALGAHIVLVHGGGPYITAWLTKLHIPTHFEQGFTGDRRPRVGGGAHGPVR